MFLLSADHDYHDDDRRRRAPECVCVATRDAAGAAAGSPEAVMPTSISGVGALITHFTVDHDVADCPARPLRQTSVFNPDAHRHVCGKRRSRTTTAALATGTAGSVTRYPPAQRLCNSTTEKVVKLEGLEWSTGYNMSVQNLKRKRTSVLTYTRKRNPPPQRLKPTPMLSNELIARIVDYLHDDPRSLKNCSLTSQAFLSRSRHILFQVVHLTLRNCQKFQKVLEASPSVGLYVKEMHVTVSPRETPPWVDNHLPAIAEKLPNVARLHIGGRAVYKAAPLTCFSSVREVHIIGSEIESTNAFLTLLSSFPHLETMYTHEMCVYRGSDSTTDDGPPVPKPPANFKALTFNCGRGDPNKVMDWLVSRSFTSTLQYYACCPLQDIGLKPAGRLVQASGPVLKHFKLGLVAMKTQGGFADIFASEFTLAKNTNLTHLELCSPAALAKLYGADDVSFDWFPLILAQVTSTYIEEVGFYLWEEDLEQLSSPAWNTMVDILSGSQFSSLKRLAFHVWGNEESRSQIIDRMRQKFSNLEDRGIIRFDTRIDSACA